MENIKVTKEVSLQRIDKYLSEVLVHSRSTIQAMIDEGAILVNGELPIIKFKHYNNINECPIRIYADFETFNDKSMKHTSKNEKTAFNTGHKPASFKILVVSDIYIDGYEKVDKYYSKSIIYKGSDADNVFIHNIQELENELGASSLRFRHATHAGT